jgi:hypothetical protein
VLASNQRHVVSVLSRSAAASLTALVLVFGLWTPIARAAEIVIPFELAVATASFNWNHGDITKGDADTVNIGAAKAEVANPAQIKVSAYQDSEGVNAVLADSGSALSELPDFHALAQTNYEFRIKSKQVQSGITNLTFLINAANC